jgi:hypothetical protein
MAKVDEAIKMTPMFHSITVAFGALEIYSCPLQSLVRYSRSNIKISLAYASTT